MNSIKLDQRQKDFFSLVDRAAFCNPFSEERRDLNLRIGRGDPNAPESEVIQRATEAVSAEISAIEGTSRAHLGRITEPDRKLVHSAFLFEIFHRFVPEFDQLITRQIAAGDVPCPVPFAREALQSFEKRGFAPEEGRRYFSFFFQMRRAFFFINTQLTGRCPSLRHLRLRLWNNIFTHNTQWYENYLWDRMEDFSTLLLGETGTGKGAAATAIGRSGFIPFNDEKERFAESFTRNFISINLSRYPESLIESELFGHKKGSFTGAISDHPGIFARCSPHGAIFLDEIGDVSIPVQIKLLQVLQERAFTPVGSHQTQRFQGRVIAATNRPLCHLRQEGSFRDDFYYRLCSDVIHIPSLRERLNEDPEELEVLLRGVVKRIIGKENSSLARQIRTLLEEKPGRTYCWPGNVRELEQATRSILLSGGFEGESAATNTGNDFARKVAEGGLSAQQLLCGYCAQLYQRLGTYEEVSRITGLDRRTVKKYVLAGEEGS